MKHIEQILPEYAADDMTALLLSDATASEALSRLLHNVTGCAIPPLATTPESEVEELVPLCLSILRRHWTTPLTALGDGTTPMSLADLLRRLILGRVDGNESLGIPPANANIPTAVSALLDRHIADGLTLTLTDGTTTSLPDGIDILAFLSSDKALPDTITEYTDTNYDWVYKVDRLTLFPNIKKATFNMKEINIDMLKNNTVMEEVHFPRLTKIDTSMVAQAYKYAAHVIWNCANLQVIDMPNIEEIYGVINWQDGVYMSAKGSEVMEFPKLKSCTCNANAAMFYFSDCRVFKLPALETMYSANAAFLNGWENLEELYLTGLKAQGHGGTGSGGAGWHSQFLNMPKLRKVVYGNMLYDWLRQNSTTTENGVKYLKSTIGEGCPNLIHIEFDGKKENTWLSNWNPKYALLTEDLEEGVTDADGNTTTVYTAKNSLVENDKFETNLEQFLYNFQTYIADRFADMTGKTAPTLTLSYEVYTALENQEGQTILATLTDKNWNVASIPQIPTA